jgi:hypothetical protein
MSSWCGASLSIGKITFIFTIREHGDIFNDANQTAAF